MKNTFIKITLLTLSLLTSFVTFAQPGDDAEGGGLESNDTPINTQLIWLFVAATIFAVYTFKNSRKTI